MSRTVAPASAVPVTTGVVSLVTPSVRRTPVSDPGARVGAAGAGGGVGSIVTAVAPDRLLAFPATSVAITVREWTPAAKVPVVML